MNSECFLILLPLILFRIPFHSIISITKILNETVVTIMKLFCISIILRLIHFVPVAFSLVSVAILFLPCSTTSWSTSSCITSTWTSCCSTSSCNTCYSSCCFSNSPCTCNKSCPPPSSCFSNPCPFSLFLFL